MRIGKIADAHNPYINEMTNYINLNKGYFEKIGHTMQRMGYYESLVSSSWPYKQEWEDRFLNFLERFQV